MDSHDRMTQKLKRPTVHIFTRPTSRIVYKNTVVIRQFLFIVDEGDMDILRNKRF